MCRAARLTCEVHYVLCDNDCLLGTVCIYPRHTEAWPADEGSEGYLFKNAEDGKDWLHLLHLYPPLAEAFRSKFSQGPA